MTSTATPRSLAFAALLSLLFLISAGAARAQTPGTLVGLGGQIGDPSGLSFKFYEQPMLSYDFLLAFDLTEDFAFLNAHRLWERPFEGSPLRYYYGPGVILGLDSEGEDDEAILGVSFSAGVNFFTERFEIFLNLTPRLRVLPATDGTLGGGGGLRYWF